jgi:Flp pilus assembly pilin Flp
MIKMKTLLKRLCQGEEGSSAIDYALLLVLLSLGVIAAMGGLGVVGNPFGNGFTTVVILIVLIFVVLASLPPRRHLERASSKNGQLRVWVNTRSGFYYCPGSRFYGILRPGEVMTQDEALRKGFRLPPHVP